MKLLIYDSYGVDENIEKNFIKEKSQQFIKI